MGTRLDLLSNESATGTTQQWPGGPGAFFCAGTFGGTTASLEVLLPDGTSYLAVTTGTTVTSNGGGNFMLPPCKLRCSLTGGTPSAMYATAIQIELRS